LTAYGSDCTNGSGTFAINTAAKPVFKLSGALQGLLTFGQFEWFTDSGHTDRLSFASELVWFLLYNSINDENIEFVLMAIHAVMDGGNVDVDDRIINELTGKAKCIFINLISSTATPNQQSITHNFLTSFSSDMFNEKYVLINQKSSLTNPINGYTMSSSIKGITYFSGSNSYNIDLLKSFIDEASDVEIALVMLHEMLHATLKVHQAHEGFNSFIDIYKDFSREEYGSELHHGIMAEKYIHPIANALAQFDNNRENMKVYTLIANTGIPEVYREIGVTDSKIATAKQKLRNRVNSNCN
jgi:hypothetical protein